MSEAMKPFKVMFAPEFFETWEGTDEELQEIMEKIQQMVDDGSLFENSTPIYHPSEKYNIGERVSVDYGNVGDEDYYRGVGTIVYMMPPGTPYRYYIQKESDKKILSVSDVEFIFENLSSEDMEFPDNLLILDENEFTSLTIN